MSILKIKKFFRNLWMFLIIKKKNNMGILLLSKKSTPCPLHLHLSSKNKLLQPSRSLRLSLSNLNSVFLFFLRITSKIKSKVLTLQEKERTLKCLQKNQLKIIISLLLHQWVHQLKWKMK